MPASETDDDAFFVCSLFFRAGGQGQQYSGGKQRGAGRQAPRHQPY